MALTGAVALGVIGSAACAGAADVAGESAGHAYMLTAREWQVEVATHAAAVAAGDPVALLTEFARGQQCSVTTVPFTTALNGPCAGAVGTVTPPLCPDGATALDPWWTRTRTTQAAPWTAWSYAAPGACPADVLPAFTATDFRRLPLTPTTTTVQPGAGYVLVGYGIIVTADPTPRDLTTTLLGYPVTDAPRVSCRV